MEDLDRFEQLLKQHSFKKLNENEKDFVLQFISSEEEYESLRNADVELKRFFDQKAELRHSKDVWLKIKQTRAEKMPVREVFRQNIPAYAFVLLLLIVGAASWLGGAKFGSKQILVEKIVSRVDTIRITSKPDTIVKEKIIYLQPATVSIVSRQLEDEPARPKGVNMKDKEELERLLVSGTY